MTPVDESRPPYFRTVLWPRRIRMLRRHPRWMLTGPRGPAIRRCAAATVTVTDTGQDGGFSFLHFDVDLTGTDWLFMTNHNLTFGFGLSVSGALISNIVPTPLGSTWTAKYDTNAGDGVGSTNPPPPIGTFSYGLLANPTSGQLTNANEVQFDVKKAGENLTVADLVATLAKDGALLFFIADVRNPNGNTGYVGSTDIREDAPPTVPIPGAVWLFGSALAGLGLLRVRRRNKAEA